MHGAQNNCHICISDNVTLDEKTGKCIKKKKKRASCVAVEGGKVAFTVAEKEDVTKRSRQKEEKTRGYEHCMSAVSSTLSKEHSASAGMGEWLT